LDPFADTDDSWHSRAERKRDDASTVGLNECIAHNVKCVRLCLERLEGGSNILCSPDFEWRDFDAERASHGLNFAHLQHGLGKANISHDCQPAEPGENLTQEFEPLAGKIRLLVCQSSDVAARPRQTCDQVATDRVDPQWKDDGNDRCRLLYCEDGECICDNDVDLEADKLGCDLSVAR